MSSLRYQIAEIIYGMDQNSVETPFDSLTHGPLVDDLLDTTDAIMELLPPTAGINDMLMEDNQRMRRAGTKLAQASLHVINECDGLHRLALAVAEWAGAVANEGGRETRHKVEANQACQTAAERDFCDQ
jgi:hypothetical protein